MTKDIERRIIDVELEVRREDNKPPTVSGYAAVFNKRSLPLGRFEKFVEVIAPGAFGDALGASRSVPLLIEHEGLALADTETKTLTLTEDDKGLRFEAELDPSDPDAQRVLSKLKRGTLRKMSFGFTVGDGGDEVRREDGALLRTIKRVGSLLDVSLVTSPAYPDTAVALRSAERFVAEEARTQGTPKLSVRRKRLLLADT